MEWRLVILTLIFVVRVTSLTDDEIKRFNTLRFPTMKERNTGKTTKISITDNNDGTQTLRTNSIPNHDTWIFPQKDAPGSKSMNPHDIEDNNVTLTFDKDPELVPDGEEIYCLPLGAVGFSVSGAHIDGWYAAEKGCPYASEFEELDICEGHPSPGNNYHYHHFSPCVNVQRCGEPSGIMGVAIDGIPIYGPWDEDGRQLTHQDLDDCGGRKDKGGRYKYHVTVDPPYYLGCLKGKMRNQKNNPEFTVDKFTCKCPYSDIFMRPGGQRPPCPNPPCQPPKREKRETKITVLNDGTKMLGDAVAPTCDFNADGDYLSCSDNYNKSYVMTKKWVLQTKTMDLAPCCKQGVSSCPASCISEDNDGKKQLHADCEREQREIKYRLRTDKTAEEIAAEQAAIDKLNSAGKCGASLIALLYSVVLLLQ